MIAEARGRDAELAALVAAGATLAEVAAGVGLSRERVRQRVVRAGYVGGRPRRRKVDDLAVLAALHRAGGNYTAAARQLGIHYARVARVGHGFAVPAQGRAQRRERGALGRNWRRRLVVWLVRDHPDPAPAMGEIGALLGLPPNVGHLARYLGVESKEFVPLTSELWRRAGKSKRGPGGRVAASRAVISA